MQLLLHEGNPYCMKPSISYYRISLSQFLYVFIAFSLTCQAPSAAQTSGGGSSKDGRRVEMVVVLPMALMAQLPLIFLLAMMALMALLPLIALLAMMALLAIASWDIYLMEDLRVGRKLLFQESPFFHVLKKKFFHSKKGYIYIYIVTFARTWPW